MPSATFWAGQTATPKRRVKPATPPTTMVRRVTRSMARASLNSSPGVASPTQRHSTLWPFPVEILSAVFSNIHRCDELVTLQHVNSVFCDVVSATLYKRIKLPVWGRHNKVEVRPLTCPGGDSLIVSFSDILRMAVHVKVLDLNLSIVDFPRVDFMGLPTLPNLHTLVITMARHTAVSDELNDANRTALDYPFFLYNLKPSKLVVHNVSLLGAALRPREFEIVIPPTAFPNVKEYTFTLRTCCTCDQADRSHKLAGGIECLVSLAGPNVQTINIIFYGGGNGSSQPLVQKHLRDNRRLRSIHTSWVGVVFRGLAVWLAKHPNSPTIRIVNIHTVDFAGVDFEKYKPDPPRTRSYLDMVKDFFCDELFNACRPNMKDPTINAVSFAAHKARAEATHAKVTFLSAGEYLSTCDWEDEFAPLDPFVQSAYAPAPESAM